jgi:tetratricopeptide (TPR) repeat protein
MRQKTYEAPGYGYWRSHPYLEDRAAMAEVRTGQLKASSVRSDPEGVRRQIQESLYRFAQAEKEPERVRALELMARNAAPLGLTSFILHRKELEERADAAGAKPFAERDYGPLLQGYEHLLEHFREDAEVASGMESARAEYERLKSENEACRPAFQGILDFGVPSLPFLKSFTGNYPDDPQAPYASLLLARNLFQLGEETEAVDALERAWASPDPGNRAMAEATVWTRLHQVRSITACQRLAEVFADTPLVPLIRQRFETVLPLVDSMKEARTFLDAYPDAPSRDRVLKRLEALAQAEWVKARVYEKMGDQQRALDGVNAILENAPESAAAERIRTEILNKANLEGGSPS